jgi:hypothetical protein
MLISKKIRLEISDQDAAPLEFMQGKCRGLYNWYEHDGVLAIDLGVKTLAPGVNTWGRFYHIGGFKGNCWYNKQLATIRSKRDRCTKGSRRYKHLSQVYQRVSQKKRNKQQDSLQKQVI